MARAYPQYLSDPSFQAHSGQVIRLMQAVATLPDESRPYFMVLGHKHYNLGYTKVLEVQTAACKHFLFKMGYNTAITAVQPSQSAQRVGDGMVKNHMILRAIQERIMHQNAVTSGLALLQTQVKLKDIKDNASILNGTDDDGTDGGSQPGSIVATARNDIFSVPGIAG
eukprot:922589-Pyramimonas_sp.AAC.1